MDRFENGLGNVINLRKMRILINRYPRACFNVERAVSRSQKCTAQLTGMPGGGSGQSIADSVELVMQAEEARDRIAAELASMRAVLAPMLDTLADPLEKTVMRMRYMEGVSVREIAYRLSYVERWIFLVLRRAEDKIQPCEKHAENQKQFS